MLRIGILSDTHLDSKATAAGKIVLDADGRNVRDLDRERCLNAAIDGMIERDVDLILHAGDLFDHPRPTPAEYVAAETALDRAAEHAWTVLIGDNHGLAPSPTERHSIAPLAGRHERLIVSLRPEIKRFVTKRGDVQVALLPFPSKALLLAKDEYTGLSPEAVNALLADKLRAVIRGLRAQLMPGIPSILLTHLLIREAIFGDEQSADCGMFAVSAEAFDGFDLVVAGDVHRHQWIGERILIPGSTDRCSFGEELEPKGWCYVEMDYPYTIPTVEFVETPARRYCTLSVDELLHSEPYPEIIYRIKATLSQEEYDALQPELARWRQCPLFSEALEITRQTRARSEAVTDRITPEAALTEWAKLHGKEAELPALLETHRELVAR